MSNHRKDTARDIKHRAIIESVKRLHDYAAVAKIHECSVQTVGAVIAAKAPELRITKSGSHKTEARAKLVLRQHDSARSVYEKNYKADEDSFITPPSLSQLMGGSAYIARPRASQAGA